MKKPFFLLFSYYFGLIVFITTVALMFLNFMEKVNDNITLLFPIIGFLLWLILFITGNINNIFNLLKYFKKSDIRSITTSIKILKFGSIPFYIINFIFTGLLFALLFFVTRGIVIILIPIPIFITWIILISTSINSILLLVYLLKNKVINTKFFILNLLAQLTFVIDIISTFVILKKTKNISESFLR